MSRRQRILIADNHGIMRDGLCALLAGTAELEVIGVATTGKELLEAIDADRPDLLIVDFSSSPTIGTDSIASLKKKWPALRILVLTFHREDYLIEAALRAGADGYLLKNDCRAELYSAIAALSLGKSYLSPAIGERVASGHVNTQVSASGRRSAPRTLTNRELEVIKLIAEGQRTREIAQRLSLSHKTIEKHRTNLMRKLGLKTATAVAAFAIANGYHTL